MKLRFFALAAMLAGCQQASTAMQQAGVSANTAQTIATDTAVAGQLFCQWGPTLIAVAGVDAKGASADSVAQACALASVAGMLTPPTGSPVPVAAPPGSTAVVATAPAAAAAAVKASQS